MRYLILFKIALASTFFIACDGAEHEAGADHLCYFWIVPEISGDNNPANDCLVDFTFIDDEGNEYSFTYGAGESALITLPKNGCYFAWVLNAGSGDNHEGDDYCGTYTWSVPSQHSEEPIIQFSADVETRPDVWLQSSPEFSFCLDDECSDPIVIEYD